MNNWLRKSLFVMVTILTFGLVTPTHLIHSVNAESTKDQEVFEATRDENSLLNLTGSSNELELEFDREKFMDQLKKQAEMQSYQKFGDKIKPVIESEFREIILPNIEKAIEATAVQFAEEDMKNLTITEQPSGGHSEKIFNIKNSENGKDILRFHVRRDNPPQDGYWFNFHYHTYHDGFLSHHNLGSIYWAKNTPPKWMS